MAEGLTIGSLFSGIGGLELGLERAGLGPVLWQVEKDPFCRSVLAKHWPEVTRHENVKSIGAECLEAVDIICGGFPCQDISSAGKGAGLDGDRSGLWFEMARVIRELRPRFVVIENVAALVTRGLDRVLSDLAEGGYDAIWFPLRAADVGAPHRRERIFVVAWRVSDTERDGLRDESERGEGSAQSTDSGDAEPFDVGPERVGDADGGGREPRTAANTEGAGARRATGSGHGCVHAADSDRRRCKGKRQPQHPDEQSACGGELDGRGNNGRLAWPPGPNGDWDAYVRAGGPEPAIRRGPHGIPRRAHRLRALGNAALPQCAEVNGHIIQLLNERAS